MTKQTNPLYAVRLDNLRMLINDSGGPQSFAKKLGLTNPSFVSHLAGPNPTRTITEKTARKIEGDLGLAHGWLDTKNASHVVYKNSKSELRTISPLVLSHDAAPTDVVDEQQANETQAPPVVLALDTTRLEECLGKVLQRSKNLSVKQLSKIVTVIYSSSQSSDQIDSMIDNLIDLVSM